jgi:hypothetical protein
LVRTGDKFGDDFSQRVTSSEGLHMGGEEAMGFATEARKAADMTASLEQRYVAFRCCVACFHPLGFQATHEHLAASAGARRDRWTADQLSVGLDLLIVERSRYLAFDAQWVERRRARKLAGRQVSPEELLERESMPWLTWPRDKIRTRQRWVPPSAPAEAFPFRPRQRNDYKAVATVMPAAAHELESSFDVKVEDDWLRIPVRIYNPVPSLSDLSRLSDRQRRMIDCLYSRHHDGHVRQQHVQRLLQVDEPWIAPYVVALVGEYVVEIVKDIADGLAPVATAGTWQHRLYGRFASDNSAFIALTQQRVMSYWREYYALHFSRTDRDASDRPEYPGFGIVRMLRKAAAEHG